MATLKVDKIINCGAVLTINANNDILYDVSIIVHGGKIIDILKISENKKYFCDYTINAEKHIVLPGFINTHTHIPMSFFKGLSDDQPLEKWLKEFIWPAEARCINPDFIYEASLHGIGELIKNGITFFNDMYFIPGVTARVCHEVGMRAMLSDIGLDFPMGDFHKPDKNFNNIRDHLEYIIDKPLIDFCIGPHSVYVASQQTWEAAIKTAQKEKLIVHTHLCETLTEVENCKNLHGKTPIEYLQDLDAFKNKFIIAHGVHLSDDDFKILSGKDCSVSINLHSNLKLASGIVPIKKYIDHGINVSFGTDSVASNNKLSIADEISTAGKLFKTVYNDPTFLPAKELVKMATINGAKALGKSDITGSIEINKSADIITINVDNFQSQPIYDPYSYIVYSINEKQISNVLVNGKTLLLEGKLQTIDEDRLLKNVKKNKKNVIGV
jgi:5-methylthioadenosine/S-adenosylhomocysteine deaminase